MPNPVSLVSLELVGQLRTGVWFVLDAFLHPQETCTQTRFSPSPPGWTIEYDTLTKCCTLADSKPSVQQPGTVPLPEQPPSSWKEREDRVSWCLQHLTDGEKAMMARLFLTEQRRGYESLDRWLESLERAERKTCS